MKKIEMYTWTYCPFCKRAKKLLNAKNIEFKEYVIDGDDQKLAELKEITGRATVPQIFVDGVFYGGSDELFEMYKNGTFNEVFM